MINSGQVKSKPTLFCLRFTDCHSFAYGRNSTTCHKQTPFQDRYILYTVEQSKKLSKTVIFLNKKMQTPKFIGVCIFLNFFSSLLKIVKECSYTSEGLLGRLLNFDSKLNLHLGDAAKVFDRVEVGNETDVLA